MTNPKTMALAALVFIPVSVMSVAGISKIYYEHTHIQQNEITVNNQTVEDILNKEIIDHKKITGQITSSNFTCVARGNHILPLKYTVTYNQNGANVNFSLPNPDMIKKVSIDGMVHNHIIPFDDTIVNRTYHITPISDNKCNVSYDVKWQNTNYNPNMWFYKIW